MTLRLAKIILAWLLGLASARATIPMADLFQQGSQDYVAGHFEEAASRFHELALASPSSGTLHNLGNAEWQLGHPGPAILAWEKAQWLDPFNRNTQANLRFARKVRQLDAPEFTWYEICSTWLPVNAWAWIACATFWLAMAMMMVPGIFRWRKAGWHQGLAAACFTIFLLTLPALAGVYARSKLGVILPPATPLRLTRTTEAQIITHLPAGEIARLERKRGGYLFIRTGNASGWVQKGEFGLISNGQ